MDSPDKQIIELRREKPDQGEIRYTFSPMPPGRNSSVHWLEKVFGIALAAGIFLLLLFFFVYVVLPIIAIILVWTLIRHLFRRG